MVEAGGVEPPFPDKKSFKNNTLKKTDKRLTKLTGFLKVKKQEVCLEKLVSGNGSHLT
jgi:hypothetical protein